MILYTRTDSLNIWIGHFRVEYSSDVFSASTELNQYESDFAIFPINNKDLLDNFPDDAFQLDNLILKDHLQRILHHAELLSGWSFPDDLNWTSEGETLSVANLFTPFVYMRTLLLKIAGEAGYSIINNPFDGEFNSAVLSMALLKIPIRNNSPSLVPVKPSFNLSDHVPEMPRMIS